jgi:hypothetical protein
MSRRARIYSGRSTAGTYGTSHPIWFSTSDPCEKALPGSGDLRATKEGTSLPCLKLLLDLNMYRQSRRVLTLAIRFTPRIARTLAVPGPKCS